MTSSQHWRGRPTSSLPATGLRKSYRSPSCVRASSLCWRREAALPLARESTLLRVSLRAALAAVRWSGSSLEAGGTGSSLLWHARSATLWRATATPGLGLRRLASCSTSSVWTNRLLQSFCWRTEACGQRALRQSTHWRSSRWALLMHATRSDVSWTSRRRLSIVRLWNLLGRRMSRAELASQRPTQPSLQTSLLSPDALRTTRGFHAPLYRRSAS